jgi:hypothetical protein
MSDETDRELEERDEAVESTEPALDPEVETRRLAAMSFIRRLGDPVLKSRATAVDRFDGALKSQVQDRLALRAPAARRGGLALPAQALPGPDAQRPPRGRARPCPPSLVARPASPAPVFGRLKARQASHRVATVAVARGLSGFLRAAAVAD